MEASAPLKTCPKCNTMTNNYGKDITRRGGFRYICRDCVNDSHRASNYYLNRVRVYSHDKASKERWRKKYPEKVKAQRIVNKAIARGEIERPIICPLCETNPKPQAHHTNYLEPLNIDWVCSRCHKALYHPTRYQLAHRNYFVFGLVGKEMPMNK